MKRSIVGGGLLVLLLSVLVVACGGAPSLDETEPVATDEVDVKVSVFGPRVIEVAPRTTVTWTWDGNLPHNVVGDGWQSQMQTSGSFRHTFETAGSYDYRCTVHPEMVGRVIVGEGSEG